MKKTITILLALFLMVSAAAPARAEETPAVSAEAAILIEAESGEVLFEKNAQRPMLIASTTKIMTAMIVLERCDPEQSVVIDPAWTGIEGSSMYLAPGQEMTIRDLLYGLMLASGNDAAVALANIAAGSIEDFAALMNEKAAELGCRNTHFENPNGLDGEHHHSTAEDMARITAEAIRNDDFREIVSCQSKTVGENTYTNHNRLLRECEGVFGVKTGYTEAAGRTLVTCCERNGLTLICVTLSDPTDWADHSHLYDWAYDSWVNTLVLDTGDSWSLPVIGGQGDTVSVSPAEELRVFCRQGANITLVLRLPSFVYAEVKAGDKAGDAVASIGGETLGTVPLIYCESIEKREEENQTFWQKLGEVFQLTERKIYTLS